LCAGNSITAATTTKQLQERLRKRAIAHVHRFLMGAALILRVCAFAPPRASEAFFMAPRPSEPRP
jgi:hypothetical protein